MSSIHVFNKYGIYPHAKFGNQIARSVIRPTSMSSYANHFHNRSNNRAFALDILHDLRRQCALVRKTHLRREGAVRHPFGGVSCVCLLQHPVNLLEGEALGFRDENVGVDEAANAERTPDEEDLGAKVTLVCVDHVGCDDADDLYRVSARFHFEGFKKRLTQFHSQLEAVDKATPRDRMGRGKTSPMTTQAPGPHVEAKKKM